jgi:RNA polymerase sigma-70 factor, ECF subfamily
MNIADLVQRCQQCDPAALHQLVQTYQPEVLRLSLSILGEQADAEEAMQDALIAALGSLDTYRGEASFKTWLIRITINVCRKRLLRRRARERLNGALQSIFRISGVGPTRAEEIIIRREARTTLWKAVDALNEKHRLPVLLHYGQELSVSEIAEVLGVPPGTVLSRLHTAREQLRAALSGDPEFRFEAGSDEAD